jgi:putative ABC transport system permease protein
MKVLKLIYKNAFRHKLRSTLTALGIAVAILAFGLLRTIIDAWYAGVEASSSTRLVTRNAVSLVFPLPLAYKDKIAKVPGVTGVSYGQWFGGQYKDPKNFFAQFAVEPESFLDLYPEILLSEKEKEDFLQERNACIVGVKLAEKYGWKLGDTFRLTGTIFPGDWDYVIRGIYRGAEKSTDEATMYFHWKYLDENLHRTARLRSGQVGIFWVRVANPDNVAQVSEQIDALFENSLAETKTETERAFALGFVSMVGAVITALKVISVVVIAIILLVLANTMAMTARERITEYAVMKTLGFRPKHIIGLIFGESTFIALIGGFLGIFLTIPICNAFAQFISENLGSIFPVFGLKDSTIVLSVIAAISVGFAAAVFPTIRAIQMNIADGLRQIG